MTVPSNSPNPARRHFGSRSHQSPGNNRLPLGDAAKENVAGLLAVAVWR